MNQTVLTRGVYNMQWLYSKVAAATSNSSIVQQQHRSTATFNNSLQQRSTAAATFSIIHKQPVATATPLPFNNSQQQQK